MEILDYNDFGLAIGLISYSFKVDGKQLFKEVFEEDLFKNHRNNLCNTTTETIDSSLYKPKGYRLFGNHGLAVLSLIDDYAFCNRIFNDNHTHKTTAKYKWSSKIITGVSDSKDYIYDKAKKTFLSETLEYPFIGIVKLKIDHRLLRGKGIKFTYLVKKAISECISVVDESVKFDHIVIDCFDNDELTVIAFSNDLTSIHRFTEKIRELKNDNVVLFASESEKNLFRYTVKNTITGEDKDIDKHVFTSCHINLGYHIKHEIEKEECEGMEMVFICETKPGHYAEFKEWARKYFAEHKPNLSITGGSIAHIILPVHNISIIETQCLSTDFNDHVRKVKISLRIKENEIDSKLPESHERIRNEEIPFSQEDIHSIRKKLHQCGVSKIVRERLLSIYRLYNESAGNLLHAAYFKELEGALRDMKTVLDNFLDDETLSIKEMDESLSGAIIAFEEAFYNRFHEKGLSNNNLEYNGSVQQYLTSFDFLYKQILRIILPVEDFYEKVFASITGYERVSSERMNLQLNINQITYPELFATTIWKEAANHINYVLLEDYNVQYTGDEAWYRHSLWKSFITADTSFEKIKFFLDDASLASHYDEVYGIVQNLIGGEKTSKGKTKGSQFLDYLIIDQIVYHFGFQRNYEMYWHFYWKYFLQTSNVYFRKGEVDREYFIDMLLRLMIVGISEYSCASFCDAKQISRKSNYKSFLDQQREKPFDSLMADLWLSCYDKVYKCAESIYKTLNTYDFTAVSEDQICVMEHTVASFVPSYNNMLEKFKNRKYTDSHEINRYLLDIRKNRINVMRRNFYDFTYPIKADKTPESPDYAICLLYAFLHETMQLDLYGKQEPIIRSVPRDSDGVKCFLKEDSVSNKTINMLADPFGGLLIPDFSIRKKYFSIRTTFYRSIWDYQMKNL